MIISKSKIFTGVCLSFIGGVLLGSVVPVSFFYLYIFLSTGISLLAVFFYTDYKKTAAICLFAVFFISGALRLQGSFKTNEFANWFGSKQKFEGYIVEDPDIRIGKQLLTIKPKNLNQRILITTSLYQNYFYGDWVVIEGNIDEPKNFEDFDYKGYLNRFNVSAVMQYPKILILKNNQGNLAKFGLLKIKSAFVSHVSKFLPEPQNSLLLGILIGAKKTIPAEITDNFNATGTSHIIAISGYNISIIILALAFLATFLGRRLSFWISLYIIIGFVILSGASASVIRAAIMGTLLLISYNVGRLYSITPSLCLTAALMLLFNPKILYWDIGFQLSFAATLGIVYLLPLFEEITEHLPKLYKVKSIILTTIAATIATLPFILLYFGRLSVVALLANVLVLPIVPITMLFGFLIAIPFISPGFALIANWLLLYILKVITYLAHLPYSSINLSLNKFWIILIFILPFILFFLIKYILNKGSSQQS